MNRCTPAEWHIFTFAKKMLDLAVSLSNDDWSVLETVTASRLGFDPDLMHWDV